MDGEKNTPFAEMIPWLLNIAKKRNRDRKRIQLMYKQYLNFGLFMTIIEIIKKFFYHNSRITHIPLFTLAKLMCFWLYGEKVW